MISRQTQAISSGRRKRGSPFLLANAWGRWRAWLAFCRGWWSSRIRFWRRLTGSSVQLRFRAGARTATGSGRQTNEDRCFADAARGLFVVCDGMGGHFGGELASEIVVGAIPRALQKLSAKATADEARQAVVNAIHAAQQRLAELSRGNPCLCEMGATVVVALAHGDTLYLTHLGDSRGYLLRGRRLRQLTADDSFVEALVAAGVITRDEARTHPRRNVVLKSLSPRPLEEPPEVSPIALQAGDALLLATDGLTRFVKDDELSEIMHRQPDPQVAADQLVQRALDRQTDDNVTCVVVRVEQGLGFELNRRPERVCRQCEPCPP